jgi:hypothetical protein
VIGVALQSGVVGVGTGSVAILMLASATLQEVFERAVHLRGRDPYCPPYPLELPYALELALEIAVSQTVLLQTARGSGRQVYIN